MKADFIENGILRITDINGAQTFYYHQGNVLIIGMPHTVISPDAIWKVDMFLPIPTGAPIVLNVRNMNE